MYSSTEYSKSICLAIVFDTSGHIKRKTYKYATTIDIKNDNPWYARSRWYNKVIDQRQTAPKASNGMYYFNCFSLLHIHDHVHSLFKYQCYKCNAQDTTIEVIWGVLARCLKHRTRAATTWNNGPSLGLVHALQKPHAQQKRPRKTRKESKDKKAK